MKIEQTQGVSLSQLCLLSGYSRQAYYKRRSLKKREPVKEDLLIQEVMGCRELMPRVGGRKLLFLMKPFMKTHQLSVGRDCFFRILGRHDLLNQKRRGKPKTTDSNHWMRKYPDLARKLILTDPGQLWVSDITYLDLCDEHVYLSLVTDAYSRKIVGFHVSASLGADGCIKAMEMAIAGRNDQGKLVHHSDRGTQYCCGDYVKLLGHHKIDISMTETGDPRDNAIAERVNGILKMELLKPVFINLEDARKNVTQAVNLYNYLRPHSSLSMLTPALVHTGKITPKPERLWKNYYKKPQGKAEVPERELST